MTEITAGRRESGARVRLSARFPALRDIRLVFAVSAAIIFSWSILMFMNYLPGWLAYLPASTILGMFAYSQIFALLESSLIVLVLIVVAAVLPARLLRSRFVAQGSLIVLLAALAAGVMQYTRVVPLWPSKTLIAGILALLVAIAVSHLLLAHSRRLSRAVEAVADRLQTLLFIYVPLILFSGLVVLVRNL